MDSLLKEFMKTDIILMECIKDVSTSGYAEDFKKNLKERFFELQKIYLERSREIRVERAKVEQEYFEQIIADTTEQEQLDRLLVDLKSYIGNCREFLLDSDDLKELVDKFTMRLSFLLSAIIGHSHEQREKVLDVYLKAIEGLNLPFKTDKEEIKSILGKHLTGMEQAKICIDTPGQAFYTLDMISEVVFNGKITLTEEYTHAQIPLTPKEKDKHIKNIVFVLDDSIGDLKLTPTQRRLLSAMGTLFLSAQEQEKECICTLKQVMDLMGYKKNPNKTQRDKVIQEMRKMSCVRIIQDLDNNKGQVLKVDESMLNYSLAIMTNKGKFVESALKVWNLPPIFKIAKHLNDEITSLPKDILKLPPGMSMTDDNLKLQDFFIKQISRLNNNPHSRSISHNVTYAKLCELLKNEGKDIRTSRVKENTFKILDYFQEVGFIKGYDKKKNGLHIDTISKKEREQLFLN